MSRRDCLTELVSETRRFALRAITPEACDAFAVLPCCSDVRALHQSLSDPSFQELVPDQKYFGEWLRVALRFCAKEPPPIPDPNAALGILLMAAVTELASRRDRPAMSTNYHIAASIVHYLRLADIEGGEMDHVPLLLSLMDDRAADPRFYEAASFYAQSILLVRRFPIPILPPDLASLKYVQESAQKMHGALVSAVDALAPGGGSRQR